MKKVFLFLNLCSILIARKKEMLHMDMNKKSLIISAVVVLVCVFASLACAIIRKFDLVSMVMFAVILVFAIVISVLLWKIAVKKKNEEPADNQAEEMQEQPQSTEDNTEDNSVEE